MSVHDDDILDFDFFEEEATREEAPRRGGDDGSGGPPGRRPSRLRPPGGLTPLLRLVGLIAFAILLVVLLVTWIDGCAGDKKRDDYADYMSSIGAVGADSAKIGDDFTELLTTVGLTEKDLESRLAALIQRQEVGVTQATDVDAPGPVRSANDAAVESLRFRVSGMQGLLDVFKATASSKDAAAAGQQLSAQGQRLVTSDVIWADLFKDGAEQTLESEDITGVAVPASVFLDNPDLVSARSMTAIWQRIHGASTGGTPTGSHGSGLGPVTVKPSGQQLSTTTETTIISSTDLAFDVAATNTGDNQEVSIKVDLTIPQEGGAIEKTQTIDLLAPGETKTVTFSDFPDLRFGEKTTVNVAVNPVPGETNTANNTAEFPVIFSLSAP
jgi:CARDB protein